MAKKYRALKGIGFPASKAVRDRLAAGEDIPFDRRGEMIELVEGDVSDKFDERSIAWLVERGHIEAVEDDAEPEEGGA